MVSTIILWKAIRSRHIFIRILVELAIILAISVLVFSYLWDYSYDGSWYHLPATIALEEGWNPLFETTGYIWIDNYPNGIWSLGPRLMLRRLGLIWVVSSMYCFLSVPIGHFSTGLLGLLEID